MAKKARKIRDSGFNLAGVQDTSSGFTPTPQTVAAQVAQNAATVASLPPAATPAPDPYAAALGQYNSLLDGTRIDAGNNYGQAIIGSVGAEGEGARRLGATLGSRTGLADSAVTPGSYDWNNVEAGNPFSQAALLQRSYHQQQARTTNGLAAQGQVFSGSLTNQRGQDTFGYQQGQDTLSNSLYDLLTGQAGTRRTAGKTRDDEIRAAALAGLGSLTGG